ncbi:Kinesin light chain 3 [Chytridiales sp. JEL 0842]|nr:Kinesin light chain 3 [Chytridiales sp. JEL 0842]
MSDAPLQSFTSVTPPSQEVKSIPRPGSASGQSVILKSSRPTSALAKGASAAALPDLPQKATKTSSSRPATPGKAVNGGAKQGIVWEEMGLKEGLVLPEPRVARPTKRDPLHISTEGVRLSFFTDLIAALGGRDALKGLTTTEVNQRYITPSTKSSGLSVVDTLISTGRKDVVTTADYFISHAWKYNFLSVVDALLNFFRNKNHDTTIIWFDLFSNSQHNTSNRPFEWWETTFMNAIKTMKNVVMVLQPLHDPIPLRRAWCVFEVFACHHTGSEFHVAMDPMDERNFETLMMECPELFGKIVRRVTVERCEAFKESDRRQIMDTVDKLAGRENLNRLVTGVFADWVIETAKTKRAEAQRENESDAKMIDYMWEKALARVCLESGRYQESKEYYQSIYDRVSKNVKSYEGLKGKIITLKPLAELCKARIELGELDETKEELLKAIEMTKEFHKLPQNDWLRADFFPPENLWKQHRLLAALYKKQGETEKAAEAERTVEQYIQECKDVLKEKGDYEPELADNFVDLLRKTAEFEGGYHAALQTVNGKWGWQGGDKHPEQLEKWIKMSIVQRSLAKGPGSEEAIAGIVRLVEHYIKHNRRAECKDLFQNYLEEAAGQKAEFSEGGQKFLMDLGMVLMKDRKTVDLAVGVAERAYQGALKTFGGDHQRTRDALQFLAKACRETGDFERAILLAKELLETSQRLHGAQDKMTTVMAAFLAMAYFKAGKIEEVERLLEQYTTSSDEFLVWGEVSSAKVSEEADFAVFIMEWCLEKKRKSPKADQENEKEVAAGSIMFELLRGYAIKEDYEKLFKLTMEYVSLSRRILGLQARETVLGYYFLAASMTKVATIEEARRKEIAKEALEVLSGVDWNQEWKGKDLLREAEAIFKQLV